MFRMLISGLLIMVVIFYAGTALAPEYTQAAAQAGITSVKGFSSITNLVGSVTTWIGWIFIKLAELIGSVI